MMKRFLKRIWKPVLFVLLAAGAAGALWFWGAKPLIAKIKGEVIQPKDITSVKKETIEVVFKSTGTITAKKDIKVTSKPSGILKAVYVKEGDFVKEGQKLGLIKPGRNEFECKHHLFNLLVSAGFPKKQACLLARYLGYRISN